MNTSRFTSQGWLGGLLAAVWLLWLFGPVMAMWRDGHVPRAICATLGLFLLAAVIVLSFARSGPSPNFDGIPTRPVHPQVWRHIAILSVVTIVVVALVGSSAIGILIYISIIAIFTLPTLESGLVTVGVIAAILVLPQLLPGHMSVPATVPFVLVVVVIWAGRQMGLRNRAFDAAMRRQRAELAIVDERNRVARDVHDILGHSLTVITLKTELAQRLIDIDVDRAKTELVDIERLAREALAGVRDTVGGLREISLEGELANARTALSAAGIDARMPVDGLAVSSARRQLFGWVLREGVTNVVRHSGARRCTVVIGPSDIEITDDGRGFDEDGYHGGAGLDGLRHRVREAGGTLCIGSANGKGFRLAATFPEEKQ